jgi:hypothetical protein
VDNYLYPGEMADSSGYLENILYTVNDPIVPDVLSNEVIFHHEASTEDGSEDYIYRIDETRPDERRISFNNTWGPTLLDGDDYYVGENATVINLTAADAQAVATATNAGLRVSDAYARRSTHTGVGMDFFNNSSPVYIPGFDSAAGAPRYSDVDGWDARLGVPNSASEVEAALHAAGQTFTGHFFDTRSNIDPYRNTTDSALPLLTFYAAHFPTKFFWGEDGLFYGMYVEDPTLTGAPTKALKKYIQHAVNTLLGKDRIKSYDVAVWNVIEDWACEPEQPTGSPYVPGGGGSGSGAGSNSDWKLNIEECVINMPYELQLFGIGHLKQTQQPSTNHRQGKVALVPKPGHNNPASSDLSIRSHSYPAAIYQFNIDSSVDFMHWRPMFKSMRRWGDIPVVADH